MPIAIAVHGGAGPKRPGEDPARAKHGCLLAARAGYALLAGGGAALEAVVEAVRVLEDDPQFNAGLGACLNEEGEVELDASVMDGERLRGGAVAAVQGVKNPVQVAKAVMDEGRHVLLCAEGARAFALEKGLVTVEPRALVTELTQARFEAWKAARTPGGPGGGTVGAVAVDARGHLAAATSTGGMIGKRRGRIGDSPILGAGTYADDLAGAASATGHGEAIMRVGLCLRACQSLASGTPVAAAAEEALGALARIDGEAGLILVDRAGAVGFAFNTERMSRAFIDARGEGAFFDEQKPDR